MAGWQIANSTGPTRPTGILLGILMGSGVGYVLGGVFGRSTASAVSDFEREVRRLPVFGVKPRAAGAGKGEVAASCLW